MQGFRQSIHVKTATTYSNSEVKCLVHMSFFMDVPAKASASQQVTHIVDLSQSLIQSVSE